MLGLWGYSQRPLPRRRVAEQFSESQVVVPVAVSSGRTSLVVHVQLVQALEIKLVKHLWRRFLIDPCEGWIG